MDGSQQWQDGYPNLETLKNDIENNFGFVLVHNNNSIIAYVAVIKNNEPAYAKIIGNWLSENDFLVLHRLAIHPEFLGQGWAKILFQEVENLAAHLNIQSIKADTNFDNPSVLHIFNKLGYTYCGKVFFRGNERLAYEKIINK
jgi:GNAT superfamily N-acetyltransferase